MNSGERKVTVICMRRQDGHFYHSLADSSDPLALARRLVSTSLSALCPNDLKTRQSEIDRIYMIDRIRIVKDVSEARP